MVTVDLIRMEESEHGSLGVLKIDKTLFCCTLEPPDLLNKSNISCIPVQQYICKRYSSRKYPNTFEIADVPDRTKVLFHSGNTVLDTAACVLLGRKWGVLNDRRAVLNSGDTFREFMYLMDLERVEKFHLTIHTFY